MFPLAHRAIDFVSKYPSADSQTDIGKRPDLGELGLNTDDGEGNFVETATLELFEMPMPNERIERGINDPMHFGGWRHRVWTFFASLSANSMASTKVKKYQRTRRQK
jgi:hypothetical protein